MIREWIDRHYLVYVGRARREAGELGKRREEPDRGIENRRRRDTRLASWDCTTQQALKHLRNYSTNLRGFFEVELMP